MGRSEARLIVIALLKSRHGSCSARSFVRLKGRWTKSQSRTHIHTHFMSHPLISISAQLQSIYRNRSSENQDKGTHYLQPSPTSFHKREHPVENSRLHFFRSAKCQWWRVIPHLRHDGYTTFWAVLEGSNCDYMSGVGVYPGGPLSLLSTKCIIFCRLHRLA